MAEKSLKTLEELGFQRERVLKMIDQARSHANQVLDPLISMAKKIGIASASSDSSLDFQVMVLFAVFIDNLKQSAPNIKSLNNVFSILGEKLISGNLFKDIMDDIHNRKERAKT